MLRIAGVEDKLTYKKCLREVESDERMLKSVGSVSVSASEQIWTHFHLFVFRLCDPGMMLKKKQSVKQTTTA